MFYMDYRSHYVLVFVAVSLVASGCVGSSGGETELTASEWCPENGHGDAVVDGCVNQTDTISIVTEQGGQIYYAEDYEGIGCSPGQVYVCEE